MVRIPRLVRFFALAGSFGLLVTVPLLEQASFAQTAEPAAEPTADANESRFSCQLQNGQYTVMYLPQSQPNQGYPWAVPEDMGSAWPAERRCQEISRRLELYRPDGLVEMQTGVENGYNTVCVTTQQVPTCRIVFTVPSGQDPAGTRDRVFENLAVADRGEMTQGVNTFVEGSNILDQLGNVLNLPTTQRSASGINLRPFLAPIDGGTGARLAPGSTAPAGRPLNPDSFR
ncbi:COP23 domain-containing protein [Pseudanabaena sp. FACHB-2040]|uniref:COP23 domain-containing protein n=1 Tax=Pseudanabaena sp. FACHB-2040 TaxID=2692859 RepID=UPI0016872E23|nr:COP23 domain-containing protein [Pseudanabaena sp. FACHB-2040]MBD0270017.1 hypothetical protein [Cyanobacteria bacterium Co-bin8]MBD2260960.1 hypothetical protein [Pseudanabaena sp. FACHB-2040]